MECLAAGLAFLFLALLQEGYCCDTNWLNFGDRCYRFDVAPRTFHDARLKCMLDGGDLASISSESLLRFIAQNSATQDEWKRLWVGLYRDPETGDVSWLDGTADALEKPWVSPPLSDSTASCFAYNGASVTSVPCEQSYGVICERPKTQTCDLLMGTCVFRAPELRTHYSAEQVCQRYGAKVADLQIILAQGVNFLDPHDLYWTSLTHNDTHVFLESPVHPMALPLQDSGTPGGCVTMKTNGSDVVNFYRAFCSDKASVLCVHTDPTPMDSPELRCPDGYNWKSDNRNNFCYWETSYETEHLSWSDAEAYCQSFGGHLASFHSVVEEKIGLSFQYGSLSHPYWIGLSLDPETETYVWSDGSPLDYSNWAPGHPNHRDKRLRCVAMEAQEKHWVSSLCGILSWFVCKVPKRSVHITTTRPIPAPLVPCDQSSARSSTDPYRFGGACYSVESKSVSWHEAKTDCEEQGARLASLHTADEIGFLLKLLHTSSLESNRVWIGLNSFGVDGELRWADWTPVDFTFFGDRPQETPLYQEKCYNIYANNGEWNNENCNAALGYVCKWANETAASAPTTQDPTIGNCKKGWMPHGDRCYYFGGMRPKDRTNWTDAARICRSQGGDLTSIRDHSEQAFLSYMLQSLGVDAWIGFHDKILTGRYYWLDNSEVRYTKWAIGEPSFFGITEECVKMVFDDLDSGVWKDDDCDKPYGYICQSRKDPDLPKPAYELKTECLQPSGWLKLEDACFRLFDQPARTRDDAQEACRREGAQLVSISDQKIKAAVQHLSVQLQTDFFIGLKYEASDSRFRWVSEMPLGLSNWEKNEPGQGLDGDSCFASTAEGYWKQVPCNQPLPYMCHIAAAKSPQLSRYTGQCPSSEWSAGKGSVCYLLEGESKTDWFTANLMCLRHASHLLSIHSMSEIEDLKKLIDQSGTPAHHSIILGLMRNRKGGFAWVDDSPVDFVNWAEGEPGVGSNEACVEMRSDTMKWRLTSCLYKRLYICQHYKDTLVFEDIRTAQYTDAQGRQGGLSAGAICAIVACIALCVLMLVGAAIYRKRRGHVSRDHTHEEGVSFENALYKVGSANMEFHQEQL